MDRLLTSTEVAERLRVSSQTIRRWIGRHGLPATQVVRGLRFDPHAVQVWLEQRRTSADTNVNDEYMTPEEVAGLLRVSVHTVRRWVSSGILPAVKLPRYIRVAKRDLDRFVQKGSAKP